MVVVHISWFCAPRVRHKMLPTAEGVYLLSHDKNCLFYIIVVCSSFDSHLTKMQIPFAEEIFRLYECNLGKTKKCVVLDCDGVLWKGILSEDGFQRIKIDRYHKEFQKFIQELFYHGIIVAICSKNDETDVLKVFQENKAMILKKNQIACWQVNWENKSENLKKIASDLNIGLDSIYF